MLVNLSIILVVLFTGYCIYYTYKRREKLTCMAGMMIAMTVGMMSSTAIGLLLGITLQRNLTVTTFISVILGLGAGYLAGKSISLMAAMDGMMAGIMGGMMGSMLGIMLIGTEETMALFIDIIFIFIMSVLIQMIDQESGKTKQEETVNKPMVGASLSLLIGIIFVGVLLFIQFKDTTFASVDRSGSTTQSQTSSELNNDGSQIINIDVSSSGYSPNNINVPAGKQVKLNFKTGTDPGCASQVVSDDLGIRATLQPGNNYISLNNSTPGVYQYTCGMGMYSGTITIK